MDILRQNLAPITSEAWAEINNEANKALNKLLTARKFVTVDGPKGWDYAAVNLGKLDIKQQKQKEGVSFGVRQTLPLTEFRVPFKLNVWELDNIVRGSEDVDFDPLIEAARSFAKFENETIFYGLDDGCITGLKNSSDFGKLKAPKNGSEAIKVVYEAVSKLQNAVVEGPYNLVINPKLWVEMASDIKGYPLKNHIEAALEGGKVILTPDINETYVVAENDDVKMTLGNDIAIGYETHNNTNVELYFTESFTFRVNDPSAVIVVE